MNRMPRISFVIPTMKAGGTERQLVYLMQRLAHDFDIGLVCTRGEGGLIGEARRIAAHVRVLDYQSGWDFRILGTLARALHVQHPDIVHTFQFGFDYWAVRAARLEGVPVVFSARRELAEWQRARHRWLVRRANRLCDGAIANSRAVAAFAAEQEGQPLDWYRVIPNGIPPESFRSNLNRAQSRQRFRLPTDAPVVGIAANFTPVKDHALFVRIAGEVQRRIPEVHFFLLGAGPLRNAIKRSLEQEVGRDAFTIRHSVVEMAEAYRAMDVSVLCSRREGSPNAVLESMAAGVPVVASAIGGIPELLEGHVPENLVVSREPSDFSDRIVALLNHSERRRALGRTLAEEANRYTVEAMVDAHREYYFDALERLPAGAR